MPMDYFPTLKASQIRHLPSLNTTEPHQNFLDIARLISKGGNRENLELFFLIEWGCWFQINQMVFENKYLTTDHVINHALSMQKAFKDLKGGPLKSLKKCCRWEPLPLGAMELNVDGAMFFSQQYTSVGIIIQNSQGEVLMAASKNEHEVNEPLEMNRCVLTWDYMRLSQKVTLY